MIFELFILFLLIFNQEKNEAVHINFNDEDDHLGNCDIHVNFPESLYYIPKGLYERVIYTRIYIENDTDIVKKKQEEMKDYRNQ